MTLDPNQTGKEFALRILCEYLNWYEKSYTVRSLCDDLVAQINKDKENENDKIKPSDINRFFRANPSQDSISQFYDEIRKYVHDKYKKKFGTGHYPDDIRPFIEIVFEDRKTKEIPYYASSANIIQKHRFEDGDIGILEPQFSGLWYILRMASRSNDNEVILNCGLLNIKPRKLSAGKLLNFTLSIPGIHQGTPLRMHGNLFALQQELQFLGERDERDAPYATLMSWRIIQPASPENVQRVRRSKGVIFTNNSGGVRISAPVRCVFIEDSLGKSGDEFTEVEQAALQNVDHIDQKKAMDILTEEEYLSLLEKRNLFMNM